MAAAARPGAKEWMGAGERRRARAAAVARAGPHVAAAQGGRRYLSNCTPRSARCSSVCCARRTPRNLRRKHGGLRPPPSAEGGGASRVAGASIRRSCNAAREAELVSWRVQRLVEKDAAALEEEAACVRSARWRVTRWCRPSSTASTRQPHCCHRAPGSCLARPQVRSAWRSVREGSEARHHRADVTAREALERLRGEASARKKTLINGCSTAAGPRQGPPDRRHGATACHTASGRMEASSSSRRAIPSTAPPTLPPAIAHDHRSPRRWRTIGTAAARVHLLLYFDRRRRPPRRLSTHGGGGRRRGGGAGQPRPLVRLGGGGRCGGDGGRAAGRRGDDELKRGGERASARGASKPPRAHSVCVCRGQGTRASPCVSRASLAFSTSAPLLGNTRHASSWRRPPPTTLDGWRAECADGAACGDRLLSEMGMGEEARPRRPRTVRRRRWSRWEVRATLLLEATQQAEERSVAASERGYSRRVRCAVREGLARTRPLEDMLHELERGGREVRPAPRPPTPQPALRSRRLAPASLTDRRLLFPPRSSGRAPISCSRVVRPARCGTLGPSSAPPRRTPPRTGAAGDAAADRAGWCRRMEASATRPSCPIAPACGRAAGGSACRDALARLCDKLRAGGG